MEPSLPTRILFFQLKIAALLSPCQVVREANVSLFTYLSVSEGDYNVRIEGISLKGEPLQLALSKSVEGEVGRHHVSAQQSETAEDEKAVEASPFPADEPDASYPGESVLYPAQPPLHSSEASAVVELAEGHGGLYESTSVIQSDDQHAQAPEMSIVSSRKLGSEEPAPRHRHMDAPSEPTIEESEYRAGEFNSK